MIVMLLASDSTYRGGALIEHQAARHLPPLGTGLWGLGNANTNKHYKYAYVCVVNANLRSAMPKLGVDSHACRKKMTN